MGKYLLFENEGESYLLYFLPGKSLNNCIFNHHYFSIPIDKHWLFKTKGDIICAAFPIIKICDNSSIAYSKYVYPYSPLR